MKYLIILLLLLVPALADTTPTGVTAPGEVQYAHNVQNIENGFSITVANRTWICYTDIERNGKPAGKITEITATKEKTWTRNYWTKPFCETNGIEDGDVALAVHTDATTVYTFNLTQGIVSITFDPNL